MVRGIPTVGMGVIGTDNFVSFTKVTGWLTPFTTTVEVDVNPPPSIEICCVAADAVATVIMGAGTDSCCPILSVRLSWTPKIVQKTSCNFWSDSSEKRPTSAE